MNSGPPVSKVSALTSLHAALIVQFLGSLHAEAFVMSFCGLLQEVGCVATTWDMYDTYNSQEDSHEGTIRLVVRHKSVF